MLQSHDSQMSPVLVTVSPNCLCTYTWVGCIRLGPLKAPVRGTCSKITCTCTYHCARCILLGPLVSKSSIAMLCNNVVEYSALLPTPNKSELYHYVCVHEYNNNHASSSTISLKPTASRTTLSSIIFCFTFNRDVSNLPLSWSICVQPVCPSSLFMHCTLLKN